MENNQHLSDEQQPKTPLDQAPFNIGEISTKQTSVLLAAEIGDLWTSYMYNSMLMCILEYFVQHVDDDNISRHIQDVLKSRRQELDALRQIFETETIPVPEGFQKKDVNIHAPRLYADPFYSYFLQSLTQTGLALYSAALVTAMREDVRLFYSRGLQIFIDSYNRMTEDMLKKGLLRHSPILDYPQETEFVESTAFLQGWFGRRRSLIAPEIKYLYFNHQRNAIGKAVLLGFGQIAQQKGVVRFFSRGVDMAHKHVEIFSSVLSDNHVPAPPRYDDLVTSSTEPPFSDKLMMYLVNSLIQSGYAMYGMALSFSARHDLALHYTRLMMEVGQYADDGAQLMIQNDWMEKPPQAPDRRDLMKHKH